MTHTQSSDNRIAFEKRVRGYHKELGSLFSERLLEMVKGYITTKKTDVTVELNG